MYIKKLSLMELLLSLYTKYGLKELLSEAPIRQADRCKENYVNSKPRWPKVSAPNVINGDSGYQYEEVNTLILFHVINYLSDNR